MHLQLGNPVSTIKLTILPHISLLDQFLNGFDQKLLSCRTIKEHRPSEKMRENQHHVALTQRSTTNPTHTFLPTNPSHYQHPPPPTRLHPQSPIRKAKSKSSLSPPPCTFHRTSLPNAAPSPTGAETPSQTRCAASAAHQTRAPNHVGRLAEGAGYV